MALPCAHGPSRAASSMLPSMLPSMLCEISGRADNWLDKLWRSIILSYHARAMWPGYLRFCCFGFVAQLRLIVAPIGGKRRKEPRSPATSMLIVYHLCERSERADNKMDKKLDNILSLHGVRRTRQHAFIMLGPWPYSKSINVREAGHGYMIMICLTLSGPHSKRIQNRKSREGHARGVQLQTTR